MQKVLFIQTAFIGDVVLATGLLETWHKAFPTHSIDIVVRKGNEALFFHHPYINNVHIWQKQKGKYKQLFLLLLKIRKHRYNYVFNLQRFAATGFLAAFSNANTIVGFNKNPLSFLFTHKVQHIISASNSNIMHEVERNHQLLTPFLQAPVSNPVLYPSTTDFFAVKQYSLKPYICIAPSSVWFTKQFPMHKWIEFLQQLPKHYVVYILGAKADSQLCENIVEQSQFKNIYNLAGKLSFLQSAALQKTAIMNYVNDSAPMHFASAVNAAVTAIYCSTIPSFGFGPLSSNSHIVQSQTPLTCKPCGLHGKKACPLQHFNCANTITPLQLLTTLPQ
jgi:heptosyltransferase II